MEALDVLQVRQAVAVPAVTSPATCQVPRTAVSVDCILKGAARLCTKGVARSVATASRRERARGKTGQTALVQRERTAVTAYQRAPASADGALVHVAILLSVWCPGHNFAFVYLLAQWLHIEQVATEQAQCTELVDNW